LPIDALVEAKGTEVGTEVDGPSHFVGRKAMGRTLLKCRSEYTGRDFGIGKNLNKEYTFAHFFVFERAGSIRPSRQFNSLNMT
jgi:hypothetical protein